MQTAKKYTIVGLIVTLVISIVGILLGSVKDQVIIFPQEQSVVQKTVDHFSYAGKTGISALDLLKQKATVHLAVSGMVDSINGRVADTKKHEYWAFYINGKIAQVGAGDYVTKDDDFFPGKLKHIDMRKLLSPLSIIIFAVILRLIPHIPNVAPIGVMALFGGAYLTKKYALIVPLIALFISVMFLGFYAQMPYVYGSFLLIGGIGILLKKHKTIPSVIGASLLSSFLFFFITNFGVWASGTIYPHTFSGLFFCYTMAIPFFRNTLLGDLFYLALFFGGYELVLKIVTRTQQQKAL